MSMPSIETNKTVPNDGEIAVSELKLIARCLPVALFLFFLVSPDQYGLSWFTAFSNDNVDRKLTENHLGKLQNAGIESISANGFFLTETARVTYTSNGEGYESQINYSYADAMPDAWINVVNGKVEYRGNKHNPNGKNSGFEFHYKIAERLIDAAIFSRNVTEVERQSWM